ncbi:Transcriptional activator protein CopR [compost metagenome]
MIECLNLRFRKPIIESHSSKDTAMVTRILIVEDEAKLANYLQEVFTELNFPVVTVGSVSELEKIFEARSAGFDVLILDRLLHGMDSIKFIPLIRQRMPELKIVVLSAINTPFEKANTLNLGADDYLAKPFEREELVARVHALLRRPKAQINFGNVVLNSDLRTMAVGEVEVELQNKEFLLLKTLFLIPGKIYNKSYLYNQVWNMSSEVESNVIESTVTKLRRRLQELGADFTIKNSRNVGYWIEE